MTCTASKCQNRGTELFSVRSINIPRLAPILFLLCETHAAHFVNYGRVYHVEDKVYNYMLGLSYYLGFPSLSNEAWTKLRELNESW